jgi:hypothetical protein
MFSFDYIKWRIGLTPTHKFTVYRMCSGMIDCFGATCIYHVWYSHKGCNHQMVKTFSDENAGYYDQLQLIMKSIAEFSHYNGVDKFVVDVDLE